LFFEIASRRREERIEGKDGGSQWMIEKHCFPYSEVVGGGFFFGDDWSLIITIDG